MTSATSLNKCSPAASFFTFTLRKQTPMTLLITAFALLLCPGVLLNEMMDTYSLREVVMSSYFSGFSVLIIIVGLAEMLLLSMMNMSFLYSKKAGDVFHALPLTRNQLLFCRVLPSFIGSAFTVTVCYGCLAVINFMPRVESIDLATVAAVWGAMMVALLLCTMFTAVFAVCSGGIFDFVIALGAVSVAIPAIYAICINWLDNIAYGVVWADGYWAYAGTSPFVFAVVSVMHIAEEGITSVAGEFWHTRSDLSFMTAIIAILFTAVCCIAVSKLFKVRRSETAGEAYSFKLIPYIISLLVSIVGGYVLGYMFTGSGFGAFDFWVFFIIGAMLCSITAGVIFSRGFKTLVRSVISGAAAAATAILLCVVLIFAGGWAESYIPREQSIRYISVGNYDNATFYDNFDIIMDIHRAVVAEMNGEEWSGGEAVAVDTNLMTAKKYPESGKTPTLSDSIEAIRFTYVMKSGARVERSYYNLQGEQYAPLMIRYIQSDEYIARYLNYDDMEQAISVSFYNYLDESYLNSSEDGEYYFRPKSGSITQNRAKELLTTYAKELKAADTAAFYEPCDEIELYGVNSIRYSQTIIVPESFSETRALVAGISFDEEEK